MRKVLLAVALILPVLALVPRAQQAAPAAQPATLAERIAHTDPARFRASPGVHGGPGQLDYMALFSNAPLDTNLWFVHRGIIQPKSGIGAHFHNYCEEMFVIFDGEAQYTIDGRTSTLKGPAGAPTRMGHSHAIYNATDKPVQWMNINVSLYRGQYDAFDLRDGRVGAPLDPIPNFMSMSMDRNHTGLRAVTALNGGKGEVRYRRVLDRSVFLGPWGYLDQYLVAPGASVGPSTDKEIGGFYYVMAGSGTFTIGTETVKIAAGDAVPIRLNDTKSFENTGTEPLELMNVGIVSDNNRRMEILQPVGRGGRGGAGRGAAGAPAAPGAGRGTPAGRR